MFTVLSLPPSVYQPSSRDKPSLRQPGQVLSAVCPYLSLHRGQNGELGAVLPGPCSLHPQYPDTGGVSKYRADIGPVLSPDMRGLGYVTPPVH